MNTILVKATMTDSVLSDSLTAAFGGKETLVGHDTQFLVKTNENVTDEYLQDLMSKLIELPPFDSGGGVMARFADVSVMPLIEEGGHSCNETHHSDEKPHCDCGHHSD